MKTINYKNKNTTRYKKIYFVKEVRGIHSVNNNIVRNSYRSTPFLFLKNFEYFKNDIIFNYYCFLD